MDIKSYEPALAQWMLLLPVDGMLVHRGLPLPSISSGFPNSSSVPIYTPGRREVLRGLAVLPKNTTQWPGQGSNPDLPVRSSAR